MSADHIVTTIHNFKTHFSRYLKQLERGEYKGVIVKRHGTIVGMFVPCKTPAPPSSRARP